jgi:hypothetical protein
VGELAREARSNGERQQLAFPSAPGFLLFHLPAPRRYFALPEGAREAPQFDHSASQRNRTFATAWNPVRLGVAIPDYGLDFLSKTYANITEITLPTNKESANHCLQ